MRPPPHTRLSVLLAYDSIHVGARIDYSLQRFPRVEITGQARDAQEALALMTLRKPRIVVADVLLSRGKGFDVLRTAKRMPFSPIVIMTSESTYPQVRRECMREGADYFIRLPHEIDDLSDIIHRLAGE